MPEEVKSSWNSTALASTAISIAVFIASMTFSNDSSTGGSGFPAVPLAELSALSIQEAGGGGGGTAAGADSSSSSNSGGPQDEGALTPELIASVFKFIPWGLGDRSSKHTLMNVLLAVGPADATTCRVAYLKDERVGYYYLLRTCRAIAEFGGSEDSVIRSKARKLFQNIRAWMRVNPGWKDFCTSENMEEYAVVSKIDEDGDKTARPHPLALFNNPAVAIECGLFEVLKCLVEEVGIDVNSMKWSSFSSFRPVNLLSVAMVEDQRGCFNYLLRLPQIKLNVPPVGNNDEETGEDNLALVHFAVENDPVRPFYLKALLHHPDVDVNETYDFGGGDDIDLLMYSIIMLVEGAGRYSCSRLIFAKMRIILEAGADTAIHNAQLALSLIERINAGTLSEIYGSQEDYPIKIKVLNAAIDLFSKYIDWENSDNESSESYDGSTSSEEDDTDDEEGDSFEESDGDFIDNEDLEEILFHEIGDEFVDIEDFEELH